MTDVKYGFTTTWDYRGSNGEESFIITTDKDGNLNNHAEAFCKKCNATLMQLDDKYIGIWLVVWIDIEKHLPGVCPKCSSPINLICQ